MDSDAAGVDLTCGRRWQRTEVQCLRDGNEQAGNAGPWKGMAAGLKGAPQRSPGVGSVRQFV